MGGGKIIIACIPAAVEGVLFDSTFEALFYHAVPVALALIVFEIAFIVIESRTEGRQPRITFSNLLMILVSIIVFLALGYLWLSNHSLAEIKEAADILAKEGLKISAIQNHYSLLNRSSETSGILDYCKENDIIFFSYMVLEQGALTGKYDTEHPFPADSDRGRTYNPMLPTLEKLNKELEKIADRHYVATAQIPVAWAIAKGTLPIIGVTKVYQVEDAVKAVAVELSAEEIETMEKLGDEAQLNVIRYWEKEMK